jgi:hypothetical protein
MALGAVAGMVGATLFSGMVHIDAETALRPFAALIAGGGAAAPAPRLSGEAAASEAQGAFAFCLHKAGDDVETTLRDLVAFHDHAATLALTECLLNVEPQRFCPPDGGRKAQDAMEIYLWARDDARISPPAHGLADKIRLLDRAGRQSDDLENPDRFALSWSGPRDRALFDRLKSLASDGYLDPGAFGYSGRPELRAALNGVKPQGSPCAGIAGAE